MKTQRVKLKGNEAEYNRADALQFFPPGARVYVIYRTGSASGMSAVYSLVVIPAGSDGAAFHPNYTAAALTGLPLVDGGAWMGIKMTGCGYNRPEAILDAIWSALYGPARGLQGPAPARFRLEML